MKNKDSCGLPPITPAQYGRLRRDLICGKYVSFDLASPIRVGIIMSKGFQS
jgi:hypothetical protein